jgi:hypothetical protein
MPKAFLENGFWPNTRWQGLHHSRLMAIAMPNQTNPLTEKEQQDQRQEEWLKSI